MGSPAPPADRRLAGRAAVVAGTGPNIGAGIALALAAAGAHVWALDANPDHAKHCADDITAAGGSAGPVVCDVTDESNVAAGVAQMTAERPIDVLVNGAATENVKGLLEMTLEEFQRQITQILTGAFLLTKHVAQAMIKAGVRGSVVNLASTAAYQGHAGNIAYTTAKAGLLNFTRSAAMELAPHGIRVNTLIPTSTDLGEMRQRLAAWGEPPPPADLEERKRRSRERIPLGVLPSPSDYGRAVVFLASDDAAMITGADLRVDAGALSRYWSQG